MTPDAWAGLAGTILGAVIGAVGTLIGTQYQAKRDATARQRAAAVFIAALARPVAVSLLEAKLFKAQPIEGFDTSLDRFINVSTSPIAADLSPAQVIALADALRNTELAVRQVKRRWADIHPPEGPIPFPVTIAQLYEELQAAAEDGLKILARLLHELGDDEPVVSRVDPSNVGWR